MVALEFFIPSNRRDENGWPTHLDGLNELIKAENKGRRAANAMKRQNGRNAEEHCRAAMWAARWRQPRGKCDVTLTFVEVNRRRDEDNIIGGTKFILDGITEPRGSKAYGAGALHDDGQRWVKLYFGEIEIDKRHPGVIVRIEEAGES